jgi:PAS domain S-box-containing protein/putative nucleotidyltransferase with HDIG domain
MSCGTEGAKPKIDKGNLSKELYRTLFVQAADGIFIADASGHYIEVNPRGCEMLGYTREEILKLSMSDLLLPGDDQQELDEFRAGKISSIERHLRRKDGAPIRVEINGKMLENGRLMGIVRDISERKKVQEEINQLSRFPAENPYPVMRVSKQGKILYANEASRALLSEWGTQVGGMLPSAWKKTTNRLAGKGSSQNVEVPCKGRIYSMTITPVRGADYVNLYGSDITEIRRSEEALRRAEEKFRNIFENSQDGIFQSTPEGRFLTANPALAQMWGYASPEELISSVTKISQQIYVDPGQRNEFLEALEKDESAVQNFEYKVYKKDGSVIWVQENARAIRGTDGNVQYYEGSVKDVTEQKQTSEALRRSEERYRRTLNNMMEGCQIIDFNWRYIYVNDTAALHGRRKPEEMLMRTMMELYPGIEGTELFAALRDCMERRTSQRLENQFTFPDGDTGWFELSVQPVPEGLFILSIDISERKQAETELKDREARYRTLFENLPIPVFTKDREGRYTSFNAEESKYWETSPIGHSDHELLPPEVADALRAVDLRVMETEEPWFGEETFQSPFGLQYSLSRKVPLYDGAGNVSGILGASVDITERKEADRKRLEAEQFAQSTIDALTAHICVLDENGVILSVNRAWHDFAEANPPVPSDHFVGMNYLKVCEAARGENATEAAPFAAGLRTVMQNERKKFELEYPCHAPDGEKRWFVGQVTRFAMGDTVRIVVAHENISERKAFELALQESEERFRSLYENAAIGIYRTNPEGRILMVNPAALRMLGYESFDELAQRNLEQEGYVPVYSRSEFREQMEKTEVITGLESAWSRKDGSAIYVRESARAVRDENGNVKYYDGTFEDITVQKWAEQALRDSEARFSTVFHASPVSIAITRLKDNVLIDVNDAWLELTGLSGDEAVGHTPMELNVWVTPDERAKLIEALQKHGRVEGFELQARKKSGEVVDALFAAELIELAGEAHMLSMAVDISDRKRAERALLESEERYRDLVDNSQELICTHDLEGNILSANPWASKTLGYKHKEILNKNIADFLRPENRPAFHKYLVDIQNKGRVQGQMTVRTRSGEQLIWEYNNSLRTEGVEQPIVRGIAHDVTEQRKAETKIRQQLAHLTALRKIDQSITSSFDLNQTLDVLVKEVTLQLEVDAAAILLVDFGANTLEFAVGNGFYGDSIRDLRLKVGEDYAGKIVLDRKMVRLSNLAIAEPPFGKAHLTEGENFVAYFGLPLIAKGQIKGVLEVFHRSPLDPDEEWLAYLETLAGQAAIAIDNAQLFKNLQETNSELTQAYDATIEGWSYALDLRDKETEGHTLRVTEITHGLCKKFGLNEDELRYVRWGALLHDIGKMGVPDAILQKPDKLSDDEWVIMKMHPLYARKMLERINYLKSAIDIPYCHHEKWDGSGYPRGLKGEQIPLQARIFAIADVWDALTSNRPYRPAWPKKDALDYIKSGAGTHFDPQVVELFLESEDLWKDVDE